MQIARHKINKINGSVNFNWLRKTLLGMSIISSSIQWEGVIYSELALSVNAKGNLAPPLTLSLFLFPAYHMRVHHNITLLRLWTAFLAFFYFYKLSYYCQKSFRIRHGTVNIYGSQEMSFKPRHSERALEHNYNCILFFQKKLNLGCQG